LDFLIIQKSHHAPLDQLGIASGMPPGSAAHRITEALARVKRQDLFAHLAMHLLDETLEPFVSCRRIEATELNGRSMAKVVSR
jgi:hypothetical protein